MRLRNCATAVLATLLPITTVLGQYPNGSVRGTVVSELTKQPIAGAQVRVVGTDAQSVTASTGTFELGSVSPGIQALEVTAIGYQPKRVTLNVQGRDRDTITVRLDAIGRVLDSVRVVGAMPALSALAHVEFDRRVQHGQGQYITQEMIERQAPQSTVDLFRRLRSVTVLNGGLYSARGVDSLPVMGPPTVGVPLQGLGPTESDGMLTRAGSAPLCKPVVYLDGSPSDAGLYAVRPEQIYGIEVYTTATAPSKYNQGPCGIVLIWSK
jgi:hypothetical protein